MKERKRDKKKRMGQLKIIIETIRKKAQNCGLSSDDNIIEYYLGQTKGLDEDESKNVPINLDSEENSCGDDSDFSDLESVERRLIRP